MLDLVAVTVLYVDGGVSIVRRGYRRAGSSIDAHTKGGMWFYQINYQFERDATHLAEPFPETVHPSISDLLDENQLFGKDVSIQLCSSSFCLITTEVREI